MRLDRLVFGAFGPFQLEGFSDGEEGGDGGVELAEGDRLGPGHVVGFVGEGEGIGRVDDRSEEQSDIFRIHETHLSG